MRFLNHILFILCHFKISYLISVNENQRPNLDELEEGAKARHDMNANTTKDAHDNLAYESNSEDGYNTFITVQ